MPSPASRRLLLLAAAAGVVLGILQLAWFYLANRAEMAESTRGPVKDVLFVAGLVWFLAVAMWLAWGAREDWLRVVSTTIPVVMAVAWLLTLPSTPYLPGPFEMVFGVAVYVAIGLALGIPAGWVAMRLRRFAP